MSSNEFRKFCITHNYNLLTKFTNAGKIAWDNSICEVKENTSENELKHIEAIVENVYDRLYWYNVLLLYCAFFEEELYNACLYVKGKELGNLQTGTLDNYKKILKDIPDSEEIFKCTDWCTAQKAFKLRHLILHANGRISRARQPNKYEFVKGNEKYVTVNNDRIHLNPEFVGNAADSMLNVILKLTELC